MGRAILILTAIFFVVFGLIQVQTLEKRGEINGSNALDFKTTRANNRAMSGMEIAMRKLKNNASWRGPATLNIVGEEVIIEAVDYLANKNLPYGHLLVKSYVQVAARQDSSQALVHRGGIYPKIYSAIGFYSDTVAFNAEGKSFEISGDDTNLDGTNGSAGSLYGIKTTNTAAYDSIYNELKNVGPDQTDNVTGTGGTPSMTVDSDMSAENMDQLVNNYLNNADNVIGDGDYGSLTLGTDDAPEITVIKKDATVKMSGSGSGIFLVREGSSLKLTGDFTYHGLVLNQGEWGQNSGNVKIYGAWIFGSNSSSYQSLELNGNVKIFYSTEVLSMIESGLTGDLDYNYTILSYYE